MEKFAIVRHVLRTVRVLREGCPLPKIVTLAEFSENTRTA